MNKMMKSQNNRRNRGRILRWSSWGLLFAGVGAAFFGKLTHLHTFQEEVHARSDQLFEQARERLGERLANPHLEEDEKAEIERDQWVHIIRETSNSLACQTLTTREAVTCDAILASAAAHSNSHWSFKRLERIRPPSVNDQSWVRNPIDQFVLSRIERAGLEPAPEASRQVAARRLWFDLIGLPPTPEEMEDFQADVPPNAYEETVENLLRSSSFGERWARTWLDVARYADSNGYEEDELRPHAYPYRDFVIWAMNHDLPFDQFIRWQIAGDELDQQNPLAVAATGFLTAGPYNTFLPQESERRDELDDMVSTLGSVMLGLTVGCARCHDHMYDPISTNEYYRLVAIFEETRRQLRYLVPDGGEDYIPIDERQDEIFEMQRARVSEEKIASLDFSEEDKNLLRQPVDPNNERQALLLSLCGRCRLVMNHEVSHDLDPLPQDEQRFHQLQFEIEQMAALLPPRPPRVLAIAGSQISTTHVLPGGRLERKGREVGPGFLDAVTPAEPNWDDNAWLVWAPDRDESPKPRTALANWITDIDSGAGPLLARVIVNRLWLHHFGRGLVNTPNDFGSQGDSPTHPELLEWLAGQLVDSGWSLKHIHRLIVNSATYRQSVKPASGSRRDASQSRLFAGRMPRRLNAEMIRDAMLATGGNLNRAMYGPGVFVSIPRDAIFNKEDEVNLIWPTDVRDRHAIWRRGIYVLLKRTNPVPMLRLFDGPDAGLSCGKRKVTTVPTQALALMNGRFVRDQAERLAERFINTTGASGMDHEKLVHDMFMTTFSRPPHPREIELGLEFLNHESKRKTVHTALTDFCHVMFMSNEFMYVD
jgi:hypothetical protein